MCGERQHLDRPSMGRREIGSITTLLKMPLKTIPERRAQPLPRMWPVAERLFSDFLAFDFGCRNCGIHFANDIAMASTSAHSSLSCAITPPAGNSRGLDLRGAYVAAMATGRLESRHQNAASTFSLEALLQRAKSLSIHLPHQDMRIRLLQSALLRRDHALLAAVVQSVEKSPFEPVTATAPSRSNVRVRRSPMVIRASERPTRRPPRRSVG